jgi:hypothetical protein
MTNSVIHLTDLRKTYEVPEREAGLKAAARSLIRRKIKPVKAVDGHPPAGRRHHPCWLWQCYNCAKPSGAAAFAAGLRRYSGASA